MRGYHRLPAYVRWFGTFFDVGDDRRSWPGQPFPLGATWDGQGTNFSLFSENAEGVELCLFDEDGAETAGRH